MGKVTANFWCKLERERRGRSLIQYGSNGKGKQVPMGPLGENIHLRTQRIREQKERWKQSVCLYLRKCLRTNFSSFTMFLWKLPQSILRSCPLTFFPWIEMLNQFLPLGYRSVLYYVNSQTILQWYQHHLVPPQTSWISICIFTACLVTNVHMRVWKAQSKVYVKRWSIKRWVGDLREGILKVVTLTPSGKHVTYGNKNVCEY